MQGQAPMGGGQPMMGQPWGMIKKNSHPILYNHHIQQGKPAHSKNKSGQGLQKSYNFFQQMSL